MESLAQKAQSDNFVQLVQQRIERMEVKKKGMNDEQVDLKKCVQYLADPVVDASVPFIYASVVTVLTIDEMNGSDFLR